MDEYIERQSLLRLLKKLSARYLRVDEAIVEIMKLPAADVAPVRHGRWMKNERFKQKRRKCSECGFDSEFEFNFCPNCGAKMSAGFLQ